MQLRLESKLSLEQYLSQEAWRTATLACCPLHPNFACGFGRHGTYLRKYPAPAPVARFYCGMGHTTFSLLPDFFACRLPGTLAELEEVAVVVAAASSLEGAADQLRPHDADNAVTLDAAKRWTRRRVALFSCVLVAVVGLFVDRLLGVRTALDLRERLGTPALLALREIASRNLHALPRPLGFQPSPRCRVSRPKPRQHKLGPDP